MEIKTEIFNLPEEIIMEFLYNLPAKSLLKFMCVSKSWYSLISSKDFIIKHLKKSSTSTDFTHHKLILSFYQPQYSLRSCSLRSLLDEPNTGSMITTLDYHPMRNPSYPIRILGSTNGLICLAIIKKKLIFMEPFNQKNHKDKNLFLWIIIFMKQFIFLIIFVIMMIVFDQTWECWDGILVCFVVTGKL